MAPAGTLTAVTAGLGAEMARVMELPETRDRLAATGVDVVVSGSDEFGAQVRADNMRYGKLVREPGLKE